MDPQRWTNRRWPGLNKRVGERVMAAIRVLTSVAKCFALLDVTAEFSEPAKLSELPGVALPIEAVLEEVWARGVAISVSEHWENIFFIAAPVFGVPRRLLVAVSVAGPAQRFDPEAITGQLVYAGQGMSAVLAGFDRAPLDSCKRWH